MRWARVIFFALLIAPACLAADDTIEGVQAAALDQPRVYVNLRRTPSGPILHTSDKEQLSGVEAFLDTGASGIMLSGDTVEKLGIKREKGVTFEDVGVGGGEEFGVAEPLLAAIASYPKSHPEEPEEYSPPFGPFRAQIKTGGGLIDLIAPGMDVVGMPVMLGKVVVLDPTPLAKMDKINTAVVQADDKRIPKVSRHVPLTIVSFAKFTKLKPANAKGPELVGNPMIGPDPFNAKDSHKPVTLRNRNKTASGTFLLDTGAAASMISTKMAERLGVQMPRDKEFQIAIAGLGGGNAPGGFFFEQLELPTVEGKPIVYIRAPFLVADITVHDETGKEFTLDGVLGMNFLVASVEIDGGLLPDIGKIVDGPFKLIVIDFKKNTLGVEPR